MATVEDNSESANTYGQARYDAYVRERQFLDANLLALSDRYSKILITLSGGALGLTITFLEKIAAHPTPNLLVILGLGWLSLLVCIVTEIFVLFDGQEAITVVQRNNEIDYQNYLNSLNESGGPVSMDTAGLNKIAKRIRRMSVIGLWSLVAGLALLCVFSATSLWRASLIADPSTIAPSTSVNPHN